MRPDISNVIVTERIREGIEYFEVKETGKEISSIVLNWLIQEVIRIQKNLIYRLNGQVYKIGNDEFHNKSRNWYSDDKM
jgi:hypothetical protein